jgi:glucose-1-phosphatase
MKGIKNIIFDLGNVILDISYQATIDEFKKLGIENFQEIFSKASQNSIADDIETGKISEEDFIAYLLPLCAPNTTHQQVIDAWNAIILSFPLRRLQILQQLQLHYNLFLLSNTNSIHEKYYNNLLNQTVGYSTLAVFFDKIYLSHRIGYRKPDAMAWKIILEQNNLKPEETLFLDDSPQHIEAANQLGIHTIHVTEEYGMEQIFKTAATV